MSDFFKRCFLQYRLESQLVISLCLLVISFMLMLSSVQRYHHYQQQTLRTDHFLDEIQEKLLIKTAQQARYSSSKDRKTLQEIIRQCFGSSAIDTLENVSSQQTYFLRVTKFREAQVYRFLVLCAYHHYEILSFHIESSSQELQVLRGEFTLQQL